MEREKRKEKREKEKKKYNWRWIIFNNLEKSIKCMQFGSPHLKQTQLHDFNIETLWRDMKKQYLHFSQIPISLSHTNSWIQDHYNNTHSGNTSDSIWLILIT